MSMTPGTATAIQEALRVSLIGYPTGSEAAKNRIADHIFNPINTPFQSGRHPYVTPGQAAPRYGDFERSRGAAPVEISRNISTRTFLTKQWMLRSAGVDIFDNKEWERFFSLYESDAQLVYDSLLDDREYRLLAQALDYGTTGSGDTAVAAWTTPSTATPVTDVRNAVIKQRKASGWKLDSVAFNEEVYEALRENAQIVDRAKSVLGEYAVKGQMGEREIAAALDVENVFVSRTVRRTAANNADLDTDTLASDYAMPSDRVLLFRKGSGLADPASGAAPGNLVSDGAFAASYIWTPDLDDVVTVTGQTRAQVDSFFAGVSARGNDMTLAGRGALVPTVLVTYDNDKYTVKSAVAIDEDPEIIAPASAHVLRW